MKSVGIDIGSYSIKIAELSGSGRNVQIENVSEYPLSQKPGTDKDLELITNLTGILAHYDREKTTFVLGLPQDKVSTRNLFFPFKEKFKILKSLPFELEDLVPFSSFDAIFEGKIVKSFPAGSEVLSVAAHKNLVKSLLSLANDVQIDPQIISLEGFALNNLFEDVFAPPPESTLDSDWDEDAGDEEESSAAKNLIPESTKLTNGEAVLDIGHSSSMLIVRSEGSLQNIRRINWGALNLAKAVAKHYNIQETEALQNIKASKGLVIGLTSTNEKDLEFSNILSTELLKLGKLLKLTLLEIKGSNSVDIKGIGLIGGLASLPNLGPKITESTLVACNRILQIKNHPEIDLKNNRNNESSMGIAIGLALESFRRPQNPAINFRRDEFAKDNSSFQKFWADWGFYVNLAAASIFVFFIYSSLRLSISDDLTYTARNNMKNAAVEVFKVKKHNASEIKLSKLFKELELREATKEKIVDTTAKLAGKPLLKLKKISEKASSRTSFPVDITSMKINDDLIEIQGSTTAKAELRKFSKKLESIAKGKITKVERPNRVKQGGVNFTITFKPKMSF